MAFVGFDLDETLGRFSTPDGHLYFLMPGALYSGQYRYGGPFHQPSSDLQTKLKAAFQTFAECLAAKEPELGMLRPGILEILGKLAKLKEEGRIKGIVVYSNNGNIACLLLATTMIEHLLGKPGLFCNHIDWWSHIRDGKNWKGRPGQATKSARVLREAFVDPRCGDIQSFEDVPLEKLYFFDDLDPPHEDLVGRLGNDRYFKVNPYKRDADMAPIDECFDSALKSQGLDNDEEYLTYIHPILRAIRPVLPNEYASIAKYLKAYNTGFVPKREAFVNDKDTILARIDTLFPPPAPAPPPIAPAPPLANDSVELAPASGNVNSGAIYFPVEGGRRRRRRTAVKKQSKKHKKRTRKHKRGSKN